MKDEQTIKIEEKAWAKITMKETHEYDAGEVIEISLFRRVLMMHKGKNERVIPIEYDIIKHPFIKSIGKWE